MASKNPDFKGATPEKLAKALARPVKRSRSGKAPAPPPAEDEEPRKSGRRLTRKPASS